MTPTQFSFLFGACVVVASLVWTYLLVIVVREFSAGAEGTA